MRATTPVSESLGLQPGSRGQAGRKGHDGTEEVPDFKSIKAAAKDVMKALRKVDDAKSSAAKLINNLAERSNTNSKNLRRLFKASLKGNFSDVRRDIEQQSVLFDQIGDVEGVSGAEEGK